MFYLCTALCLSPSSVTCAAGPQKRRDSSGACSDLASCGAGSRWRYSAFESQVLFTLLAARGGRKDREEVNLL